MNSIYVIMNTVLCNEYFTILFVGYKMFERPTRAVSYSHADELL